MKLYATVTSERASKGQGGNYLDIDIKGADKTSLWSIGVLWGLNTQNENNHLLTITNVKTGKIVFEATEKGEKQKGEDPHDWIDNLRAK